MTTHKTATTRLTTSRPVSQAWDNDIFPVLRNSMGLWFALQFLIIVPAIVHLAGWKEFSLLRALPPLALLSVLLFLLVPFFRKTLKQWYTLTFIALLTVIPVLLTFIIANYQDPQSAVFRFIAMSRGLPLLYCALVLASWYYGFKGAFIYTLVSIGIDFFTRFILNVTFETDTIQFVSLFAQKGGAFITIGFLVSSIVKHVRNKSTELIAANGRLIHYSDTLEELAVTQERTRMARELHDTLAHSLTALTIQLEATKALMNKGDPLANKSIQTALDTARSGLKETRYALKSLRSSKIEQTGLSQSLRDLTHEISGDTQMEINVPDVVEGLSEEQEHVLFRIAQEATHNAIKHANASTIRLDVLTDGAHVCLRITDNGVGFDSSQPTSGFGLTGMTERSLLVDAQVEVTSQVGKGTTVTFKCPRT